MVVSQGLTLALAGVAIGVVGAMLLTRVMSSMLYKVSASDPATFVLSAVLFLAVASLASYLPARRATRDRSYRGATLGGTPPDFRSHR